MKGLSEERQGWLSELLQNEKRRLWTEVRRELFAKIGDELHDQYELPQDLGERGLIDVLEDTGLALADIRRRQLTAMDEALTRLQEGRYGICEDCGEEIQKERLRVSPYVTRCLRCQNEHEGPPSGPGLTL